MDLWNDEFDALKRDYLSSVGERLETIRCALDSLESDPADAAALAEVRKGFHKLAGSAGSCGFVEVTPLAFEAEQMSISAMEAGGPVTGENVERWRRLLAEIDDVFAAAYVDDEMSGEKSEEVVAISVDEPRHDASGPQAKVLVVDGDEAVCRKLDATLAEEGIEVRGVATRHEATREIASYAPDALLVNVALEDSTGYEFVEYVRGQAWGETMPILMVSGTADFLDKVEAIRCGADGYFENPLENPALLRRLQHLLESTRPEPARVLSVEDDEDFASFVTTVLESAGFQVRTCPDPRRFENELTAFKPDLVIMDLNLPEMSGTELVRYLRQHEQHATLPIVFLTAEQRVQARIESLRAGGDDYLVKPVTPGMLLATVASRVERARFLNALLHQDGLTRLLTHASFMDRAKAVMAREQRRGSMSVAVVLLDIDRFKGINDRYGHQVGDKVLTSLSSLLRRRLRRSDTIGRYGGEEFVLLLEDLEAEEARRLVQRLLDEFATVEHVAVDGERFTATFSAGVAMLDPNINLGQWVRAADEALYEAKAAGRNRIHVARPVAVR